MTNNHLAIGGKEISQQQSLVSIYWDYQNIPDGKQANNENKTLKSLADKFYFVDELPKLLESYKLAA